MSRRLLTAVVAGAALVLAGCSDAGGERRSGSPGEVLAPPAPPEVVATQLAAAERPEPAPLRKGERRVDLRMPSAYTPAAPTGTGTDDYRCFLLDPELAEPAFLTGTHVLPGTPEIVHHVILFRIGPELVDAARAEDAESPEQGWTCFGGTGLEGDFQNLEEASWLGAWAPGGAESTTPEGYGVPLAPGSRIVMQVHYNLLSGAAPDRSATSLRLRAGDAPLTPMHTYLMPSPVELPCRPDRSSSRLCNRENSMAEVRERFGEATGNTNNALYVLCGGSPKPSQTSTCTRTVRRPTTVLAAAGHMHLLGRTLRIQSNAGTPREQTVLDIPTWDFDDQGAKPLTEPLELEAGDSVTVTCEHVQWLRDKLPAFEGQEERYVVWAEGTTDEMCLGILQVAYGE